MNFSNWLEKWGMTYLKITPPFLQMEWIPKAADKNAAWALYIELLTRITTQPLPIEHGNEKAALDSVYSLFATTREVIREYGPECIIVNSKNKYTLSAPSRCGFLTAPMLSVQVITESTITLQKSQLLYLTK